MSPVAVDYGSIWAEACGRVVAVHIMGVGVKDDINVWTSMKIGTLPTGYRPARMITAAMYESPGASIIQAATDGSVSIVARDTKIQKGSNIDGTLTFIAN